MKQIIFTTFLILAFHSVFYSQTNKNECPDYVIFSPDVTKSGDYAFFQLRGDETFEKLKPSYTWTISDGEIYAGQGTKILIVSSKSSAQDIVINAVVIVQGLPAGCANTESGTTAILGEPKPLKLNEYANGQPGSIKAVLDSYYIELNSNPTASGVITIKSKTKESVVKQIQAISKAIYFRKFDLSRVSFRIIFNKDEETTEYWLVPPGAYFPFTENAININASEYENLRKFFAVSPRKRKK